MNSPEYSGSGPTFLPVQSGNVPVTMSSREIAELCEKQHQHVKRDFEAMCKGLKINPSTFGRIYQDARSRDQIEYVLPKRETLVLVSGYSVELRARIVDRVDELERGGNPAAVDYSNPQVLIGVLQHLQGQVASKDLVIADQGQRLTKLNRIEGSSGNLPITDSAKVLKVKPRFLTKFLHENRWIYKRPGSHHWLAYQRLMPKYLDHRDGHYLDDEGEKHFFTYAVVTPAGIVLLAQMLEDAERSVGEAN